MAQVYANFTHVFGARNDRPYSCWPLPFDLADTRDAREPALQFRIDGPDQTDGVAVTRLRIHRQERLHVRDSVAQRKQSVCAAGDDIIRVVGTFPRERVHEGLLP